MVGGWLHTQRGGGGLAFRRDLAFEIL
jgi:hypothetical protein